MRWTLHVLTACTRPENLERVADSIFSSKPMFLDVHWHVRRDTEPAVGGQRVKNEMLDNISEGWIVFLDDDTAMHPQLLQRLDDEINPNIDLVFYAQQRNADVHMPLAKRGLIDIGQVCVHRRRIGPLRIPDFYDGDGWFCEALVANPGGGEIVYLPEVLSFYNLLA